MKVMTILGTRPEIIRLSLLIPLLDRLTKHTLVHTGQNYAPELDSIFFKTLRIRNPDAHLELRSETLFGQISRILEFVEKWIDKVKPHACLILGDTNSGLSALVAAKKGIPVFHMEAGNRCFDSKVPEELNRKLIDHASTWLLPYVENSRNNLLNEGIPGERIFVTGNPIFEVLEHYKGQIKKSRILNKLSLKPGKFFLVTLHRQENVDVPDRLSGVIQGLNSLAQRYKVPIIMSCHPRTRSRLQEVSLDMHKLIKLCVPFDLFDFVTLEQKALCVLTDSGTVQEECCIFQVPTITLRDTTERPETVACGSNILTGCHGDAIVQGVEVVTKQKFSWQVPPEYLETHVSEKVLRLIFGHAGRRPQSIPF